MTSDITNPERLYSRSEVLSKPSPVPTESGLYAWYFADIPSAVPVEGCLKSDGKTLLYLGISPDKSSKPNSTQNLNKRVTYHYRGNAEGSTLRRTLGILLADSSGYTLRRVGSGRRMTLTHSGEDWLNEWMEANAFVCWITHERPWEIEEDLIASTSVPLNIRGNQSHPFYPSLRVLRRDAISRARELSVADNS